MEDLSKYDDGAGAVEFIEDVPAEAEKPAASESAPLQQGAALRGLYKYLSGQESFDPSKRQSRPASLPPRRVVQQSPRIGGGRDRGRGC